jgi:hypothetical protein
MVTTMRAFPLVALVALGCYAQTRQIQRAPGEPVIVEDGRCDELSAWRLANAPGLVCTDQRRLSAGRTVLLITGIVLGVVALGLGGFELWCSHACNGG